MGLLLKQVLKTLCGVNQWCYAVFWKIGCHNSKLLIWEECYYEPNTSVVLLQSSGSGLEKSELPFGDWEGYWATDSHSQLGLQTRNTLQSLVNKMMMSNQVNLVGQGIVGRAAFTGNHEWILAGNFAGDAYPPEVLGEIQDQLSGGMQTIAVIPTLHGVVQLGSSLTIMENMGFVNNVKSLILQLGCVPGALLSDNLVKESTERIGVPVSFGMHDSMSRNKLLKSSLLESNSGSQPSVSSPSSTIFQPSHSQMRQIQDNLQSTASTFSTLNLDNTLPRSHGTLCEPKMMSNVTPANSFQGRLKSGFFEAEVNKQPSSCNSSLLSHHSVNGQSVVNNNILVLLEQLVLSANEPHILLNDINALLDQSQSSVSGTHAGVFNQKCNYTDVKHSENGTIAKKETRDDYSFQEHSMLEKDERKSNFPGSLDYWSKHASGSQSIDIASLSCNDSHGQPLSGDDLYDVLGADFKKRLLNSKLDSLIVDRPSANSDRDSDTSIFSFVQETSCDLLSNSSFFMGVDSDHLLDAVVSKAHSDDNVPCNTTLTKVDGSSDHNVQKDIPSCFEKSGIKTGSSLRSGWGKNDTGSCLQTTSVSGSRLNLRIINDVSCDGSVSTAYSKKSNETSKPSRKRLKPGGNPRPRPKDRQMIQDRVKELREIVPNGAKCSIDTLLERTIKHMLFLQSVTKHADKLKQTGESKIRSKEGGLVLKDNYEGGATWAFEVGSKSMVCPIIVEDLNSSRQMLVEMLCEEGGFFLDIADLIRGLGLTILKGVMEARDDKTWARFAVEGNRDVTRMEVFMSLLHLLKQTETATLENNMMVHHNFSQPTSVPAAASLQYVKSEPLYYCND